MNRLRLLRAGLAATAAAALVLALTAAPAAAEEKVESFKTTMVETNTPLGAVAVAGLVGSEPSGESFTIETSGGSTDTVNVSHPLRSDAAAVDVSLAGLSDSPRACVVAGEPIASFTTTDLDHLRPAVTPTSQPPSP